jgi:hypothetical protein
MIVLLVLSGAELTVGVLAARPLVLPAAPQAPARGGVAARGRLGDRG